jgi:branched-chain amino acid transport system ATP-binding protein
MSQLAKTETNQAPGPVLSVRNLAKHFGGVKAVRDVSFDLARGELLAFIGPNGAGKTTTFNMLNGQLKANGGSVNLDGQEIIGMEPREVWKLGVGRTFQITATFGTMTVLENVQTALMSFHRNLFSLLGKTRSHHVEEATALLHLVGLEGQLHRACNVMAYGDLKRLELAVALANNPKLLLMDEPAAGMAPLERIELMQLTADIVRERNISVLFTEHDMDVVFAHAHRIIVLNRGELIAEGSPEEVRNNARVQEVYLGGGTTFKDEAET